MRCTACRHDNLGDEEVRVVELRTALRVCTEIGATGWAARIARELEGPPR